MFKKYVRWDCVFVSISSKLGKVSSFFFFTGLVFGKAQYLPIPIVSTILNVLSLLSYLMAYSFWFISSHFYPNHTQHKNEWYGFAQFKEQYLAASVLGLLATSFSLAALLVPVLLIPAAWIFLASNLMWTFAEYHKFYNPPTYDENYSHSYQDAYLSHAITITSMSVIATISATLVFLFPPITLHVFVVSSILLLGLTLLAAETWLNFNFGGHKPNPPETSYTQMNNLGPKLANEHKNTPAPYHGADLFNASSKSQHQPEPIENPIPQLTCSMPN